MVLAHSLARLDMNPPLAIAPLEDLPEGSPSTALSPLSKNAQKRARKAALFAEHKLERRAREKEARKEKKRLRGERIAAGEQVSEDDRSSKRAKLNGPQKPFRARVVVDLGFDEKMSDKVSDNCPLPLAGFSTMTVLFCSQEITSLCSQLAYTYSTNRRSQTPFHTLLFTSLNGRTLTRLESMNDAGYKRWTATEWWTGSYERLWQDTREITDSNTAAVSTNDVHGDGENRVEPAAAASKDNIIYLTADSSEELSELKEGETYIIGGICDHNRYKVGLSKQCTPLA